MFFQRHQPGGNSKWCEDSVSLLSRIARSTEEEKRRDKRCSHDEGLMPTATSASTQKKRRRQEAGLFAVTDNPELARLSNTNDQEVEDTPQETPLQDQLMSDAIRNQSWWESTNASSLFGELRIDEDVEVEWNTRAMAEKRISRLRRGHTTADSWKLALDDSDARNICSGHDAFQMKCECLSVALGIALDDVPSRTWLQCCKEAVKRVNQWEGHEHARNGETARIWHHDFRGSDECF
jgi:hypothetical protein